MPVRRRCGSPRRTPVQFQLTTSDPNLGLLLKIRKKLLPTGNTADQTEGGRENLLGMHRPLAVLGLGGGGALATEQEVLDGGDEEAEQEAGDDADAGPGSIYGAGGARRRGSGGRAGSGR
jgi:hypothetical protein